MNDRTLRLVIAYKLAHAGGAFVLSALLLGAVLSGRSVELMSILETTRTHGIRAWIALLLRHVTATSPAKVWLSAAGIVAADGVLTSLEAWGLARGRWWGPWLVVVLTGVFVPGELVALSRHASLTRIGLLVANVAIAIYLARRARRHARAKRAS